MIINHNTTIMKRLLLGFLTICLLSCGASKTVRDSRKIIKGNWTLDKVTSSVIGELKITLLNDASKACFEGSSWQFIPNNNTGNYTLSGADCDGVQRYFVFTIDEIDEVTGLYDFLLKPTDQRGKSETNRGFRLSLTSLTDTTMEWEQTVSLEGKPVTLKMSFYK